MPDSGRLTCFASHRCEEREHAFLARMSAACECCGVRLLVDPFEVGHHVQTRMETVAFDSFLFLCTPASWASAACQTELRTASTRHVPVITVRLWGEVPAELRDRVFLDVEGLSDEAGALNTLAAALTRRARLHRRILALDLPGDPATPWAAAELLVERVDSTLLAESVELLAAFYRPDVHPATRYWLALALGKAGTARAGAILDGLAWETHPYPLRGIREARQSLGA
jgi:hypothetical protein